MGPNDPSAGGEPHPARLTRESTLGANLPPEEREEFLRAIKKVAHAPWARTMTNPAAGGAHSRESPPSR
jgi:hypothetical protein